MRDDGVSGKRNVFTIAPGAPFLETFVDAFLSGGIVPVVSRDSPPLLLARSTIYVPTRRAGRALAAEFARAFGAKAALLPRILPLGGLEESETQALFGDSADDFDEAVQPAIGELERRLLLARLVMQWSNAISHAIVSIDADGEPLVDDAEPFLVASTPAGAYSLAADLGALIDEFVIEGVAADALEKIVDETFDRYWSITTRFLGIAVEQWPEILRERGRVDASTRRKRLLEAQIERLRTSGGAAPVVAIGSTGAQPTTAWLLSQIAALEYGAVVLPGLDCDLDDEAWALIGENEGEPAFTHPQTMLKRLLGVMKLARDEVRELARLPASLAKRRRLVAQAMLPAEATPRWRSFRAAQGGDFAEALSDVIALEAPDERTEALSLALFMREALETPGRTAALVTPDRNIARRVAAELQRFGVEIDDSGGASLASTRVGALAREIAAIGATGLGAVGVATLLAHPLARFGHARAATQAPLVEIAVLRALPARPRSFSALLEKARAAARDRNAHPAAQSVTDAQWNDIASLLRAIEAALAPFAALRGNHELKEFARAHRAAFEAIAFGAEDGEEDGAQTLFELFDKLCFAEAPPDFDASSYAALFERIAFETTLRGPRRAHPRVKILGPLEARLMDADLLLLAGLDEGVWPPQTETGAFLNRSMRRQLGLSPPERRIGQSAHDFVMALGAKSVVLSRAAKRDGSPTVASRFLARLEALAGEAFGACKARGEKMLAIAVSLDRPQTSLSLSRPEPSPPLALRPQKLSVTRIEVLRRDPYAIFAEYILNLKPLAPLGSDIGAREMGTAIHAALEAFVKHYPSGPLPADARGKLHEVARGALVDFFVDPAFEIFTWPRLVSGLDHALAFEAARRAEGVAIHMEKAGKWTIPLRDGSSFTLTAKADRIEVDPSGRAFVFDYKTGAPPTNKQVEAGWAPQLTLEAAMIEAGAFADVGARNVAGAAYVGLKNDGDTQWVKAQARTFADLVAAHRDELKQLLDDYREQGARYPSRPYVALVSHTGDFDHLARVKEWSRGGGDGA